MSRVILKEVIAIRCDVRACAVQVPASPRVPFGATWHDQVNQIHGLVEDGWSFVLTSQLRSYCPLHAERVWQCTCRTHPTRRHLCTAHSDSAAAVVWDAAHTPNVVSLFLEVTQ